MKIKEKANVNCQARIAKTKQRRRKQNSGITLIALVVTIVVLIILSTVSISAVFSENGIIRKAELARDYQANAEVKDSDVLDTLDKEVANAMAEPTVPTTPAGTVVETPSTWTTLVGTAIADGGGHVIPLPEDFYYVGGDYNTGLVISDKSGDTLDASGTSMGNQFVWIPVDSDETFVRESFESSALDTTYYTEPYASGYSDGNGTQEASEYNTMRTKVLQYGGFYIGRFEAGINSIELRTTYSVAQTVVSKKQVAPYNYVPWGTGMSDASEISGKSGAVYLAKSMYANSDSVTSTLCYGVQWDAMCRYIGDYTRTTPPKDAPELTGSVSTDVSKRIYDLAGNCVEWTMEAYTIFDDSGRVRRGGHYNYGYPVSIRNVNDPIVSYDYNCFRCTLYVK